jgi:hypothetical protein
VRKQQPGALQADTGMDGAWALGYPAGKAHIQVAADSILAAAQGMTGNSCSWVAGCLGGRGQRCGRTYG